MPIYSASDFGFSVVGQLPGPSPQFFIVNRHKEILCTDGNFHPAESSLVVLCSPKLFPTEAAADQHRLTIRDYTRVVRAEASL